MSSKDLLIALRARLAPVLPDVAAIHARAMTVPGWISGADARALARAALALPPAPLIVEVGVFMGRSTALLAGALHRRGDGRLVAIDPFDNSGEAFSLPHYERMLDESDAATVEDVFRFHMRRLGLLSLIEVRRGLSSDVARDWDRPIDLLSLDADHSREGARKVFDEWIPHLREGGALVLANSAVTNRTQGHDGHRHLIDEGVLAETGFGDCHTVGNISIARKVR